MVMSVSRGEEKFPQAGENISHPREDAGRLKINIYDKITAQKIIALFTHLPPPNLQTETKKQVQWYRLGLQGVCVCLYIHEATGKQITSLFNHHQVMVPNRAHSSYGSLPLTANKKKTANRAQRDCFAQHKIT